jgi:hypothetical protein
MRTLGHISGSTQLAIERVKVASLCVEGEGAGTTPVAAARVLTLVEIGPLVELAPSVHTVGDGGHAVGARDADSEMAGMATVVSWAATSSA